MSVKKGTKTFHRLRRPPRIQRKVRNLDFCVKFSGVLPRYAEGRLWEAARLASLLGGGASRIAFGRRCVSRRFWETARLASLLGDGASRVAFGRRRVSRRFCEAAHLASLLGGGASRVASQEIPLPRRGGERSETEWLGILGVSDHPAPKGHPSKGGEFSPDRYAKCRLLRGRLRLALALPTPTALRSIPPELDWPKLGGSQGGRTESPANSRSGTRSDRAGRRGTSCPRG